MRSDGVHDRPNRRVTREGTDYEIRRIRRDDIEGFLALYQTVWGIDRDPAWFRQTYADIPYVDRIPVFVAEADGEIVGARPTTAFRVRGGAETAIALLTRDTMVHPAHRRRGIFTEMTEVALEVFESGDPSFIFSHSNTKSLPGYRKLGWRPIRGRVDHYRIQDPKAFIDARCRDRVAKLLAPMADPLYRGYLRAQDRRRSPADETTIECTESIPIETFAALYERRPPETLHPVRDESFYDWRFRSPEWRPLRTYVGVRDGRPIAGLITSTSSGRLTWTAVVDVVPRAGGERWRNVIAALIDRVIQDYPDSDVIRVPEPAFPSEILERRGFFSTDRLPLSAFMLDSRRLTLAARPLGKNGLTVNGRSVADGARELWSLAH